MEGISQSNKANIGEASIGTPTDPKNADVWDYGDRTQRLGAAICSHDGKVDLIYPLVMTKIAKNAHLQMIFPAINLHLFWWFFIAMLNNKTVFAWSLWVMGSIHGQYPFTHQCLHCLQDYHHISCSIHNCTVQYQEYIQYYIIFIYRLLGSNMYIYISIHAIVCIYLFVYVDCWLLIVVCTHLITSSSKFHLCYDSSSCNLIYNPCMKHVPWNNVVYVHPTLSIQNRSYPAIIPSNYS